jgi:hypothetical protein
MGRPLAHVRVVDFLGPVGVGKSTQICLLRKRLSDRGYRVASTFLKTGHLFSYLFLRLLARGTAGHEGPEVAPIRALVDLRPDLFRRLFRAWLVLDVVSVVVKSLFAVYLPVKSGYLVLVEEGIPATMADYFYLCDVLELPLEDSFVAIRLLAALHAGMGPVAIALLDADKSSLRSRSVERGGFIEREDYVLAQRELIPAISRALSRETFLELDTTSRSRSETSDFVEKWLVKILTTGGPYPHLTRDIAD